ncbi:MAG TPA: DUF4412 domain-containing protein [Woeseiaceae bacterium]|nr:DUF4412 domain-containing protein [Woeseiaceae bacterium]
MSLTRKVLLVATLALPLPALAGGVLVLEVKEYYEDPPVVSTIEISTREDATRMEVATPGRQESGGTIYRGDSGEMIVLDHGNETYYVLDEASMQQMGAQLSGAMKQMQEALEAMPPEQRAMAEKMMKQHMPQGTGQPQPPPATVHALDREDTVSGFECDYYEVRRADRKIRELCVTPWEEIPGGRDIADAMLDMAGFFDRMTSALSKETGIAVMGGQQEIFAHLEELDGYPVLTREFDRGGAVASESVLKSATAEELDPSVFEPPTGYREMSAGF